MSSHIIPSIPIHPSEELLEEYSFGRISEPALAPLEEHLLDCSVCQDALVAIDHYKALMKAGIAAFEHERQTSLAPLPWFALPRIPGLHLALAGGFMLLLVVGTIAWRLQPASVVAAPETVRLVAMRGASGDGVAHARAGRPLDLVIDRTDLPGSLAYSLEVVSSAGRQIWSGAAQTGDQDISAHIPTPFRPGAYWVRLYASGGRLRREFSLRIQ